MTVKELIEFLQTQPRDIQATYDLFSEQCILDFDDIRIQELCAARPDGWVENKRPGRPTVQYLCFPGN